MKKLLAMLLVFVMLVSLCACGDDEAVVPGETETQETSESVEETEETQETAGETAEDPTEESAEPTETTAPPAQVPTEAPAAPKEPTTCSHNYTAATCSAPKTCTKCGATEGSAAGHNYNAATCSVPKTCTVCGATEGAVNAHNYANGACTMCGAAAPKSAYDEFVENVWTCAVVKPATEYVCETYFVVNFDPGWDFGYSYKSYFSEIPESEGDEDGEQVTVFDQVVYNGKTYYDLTFSGSMGGWECKDLPNGNVQIEMMNEVTIEVKRDAPGKFSVVSINDATFLPVGAVLNKLRAVE